MCKPKPINLKSPSKKHVVYILMAGYDYEYDTVLDVFAAKESADKVYDKIMAHIKKMPHLPDGPFPEMPDAEYEEYAKKDEAWRKRMPYGSKYDSYNIIEKELK